MKELVSEIMTEYSLGGVPRGGASWWGLGAKPRCFLGSNDRLGAMPACMRGGGMQPFREARSSGNRRRARQSGARH